MIRTTALAALIAVGACSSPPAPQPIDHPDQPVDPEPATQPDAGEIVLQANAVCTAMACPADNPCCNSCGFQHWMVPDDGSKARSSGEPLPQCQVDGCGRCPFVIYARGERQGSDFAVASWRKGQPVAQTPDYTMADLEAVLKTSGCAAEADCASVGVGQRLCGGPDSYLVYCKTTTDLAKMQPIVNAINEKAAKAAEEQAKQGMAGTCVVATPPTIALEDGVCVAK